jgi:hypothetical protein
MNNLPALTQRIHELLPGYRGGDAFSAYARDDEAEGWNDYRAKIIELVPEIKQRPSVLSFNGRKEIGVPDNNGPKITLADVLRAISEVTIYIADGGEFFQFISFDSEGSHVLKDLGVTWNLNTDYDGQTDEVKAFIGSLLGV